MPETHQPIIVDYLLCLLLKDLVELQEFISDRIANYYFQFLRMLHSFFSAGLYTVEFDNAFFYAPHPLIDRAALNDTTFLTTYTTHTHK